MRCSPPRQGQKIGVRACPFIIIILLKACWLIRIVDAHDEHSLDALDVVHESGTERISYEQIVRRLNQDDFKLVDAFTVSVRIDVDIETCC